MHEYSTTAHYRRSIAELISNVRWPSVLVGLVLWGMFSLGASAQNGERDGIPLPIESAPSILINKPDVGFRGIWYYNQRLDNEYVFKYSGGLGTYCANHYPFSIYAPAVNKTFFCYGGTSESAHLNPKGNRTLLHEIAYFDHETGNVSKPTILLDKQTDDAHDNPVLSIDTDGYLWVFSTSHGTGRPSYISRSKRPYDIAEFELVAATKMVDGKPQPLDNFSYFQIWHVPQRGFVAFFTTYDKRILNDPSTKAARIVCFMTSPDGVHWSAWQPLAGIVYGHYQNASVWKDKKIATAFNYHPNDPPRVGLNYRTNLYYMQSGDFGKSWTSADGTTLEVPLRDGDIQSPALVHDYRAKGLNVYGMDLLFDSQGNPIILYLTSTGFESGPENGPRIWHTAAWNGSKWDISDITESDNNYDYGSLFILSDTHWRVIGTTETGPQAFNTGGEVAMWETQNRGKSWILVRKMTQDSEFNHCYPRRTVNAHADFYALWASGHGRQPSQSFLYFCNDKGDVFQLPERMLESDD